MNIVSWNQLTVFWLCACLCNIHLSTISGVCACKFGDILLSLNCKYDYVHIITNIKCIDNNNNNNNGYF